MLSKCSVWWYYLIFLIFIVALIIGKATNNEYILYICIYIFLFVSTEKNVEKVISKDFKKLILFYISLGLFGALLILLLKGIGLFLITITMIVLAIKITLQSHLKESKKNQYKFKLFLRKTFFVVVSIAVLSFIGLNVKFITEDNIQTEHNISSSFVSLDFKTEEEKKRYIYGTIEEKIIILKDKGLSKEQVYDMLKNNTDFRTLVRDDDDKFNEIYE